MGAWTRFLAVLSHDGERNFGTVVKVEPWQSQAIQARAGHIIDNFDTPFDAEYYVLRMTALLAEARATVIAEMLSPAAK